MKKIYLILTLYSIDFCDCLAQNSPSIQTDRPDQTECPFITPKNYLQFENGFSYEKTSKDSNEFVLPTTLTKYGINDHFELRLITEYVIENNNSNSITGIVPVLIGFKTRLLEEKGIVPTTSFIAHLSLPKLASKKLQSTFYTPEFRFTMQHTLSQKQTLSYNIGAEWNGINPEPTFIYTLTTGYSLSEKIGAYIELYGFLPQIQKPDHRCDAGFTYLVTPNHQLDISGGFGLSEKSPQYYFAFGYSFRFKV